MKPVARQDVLNDRNYATAPHQYQRPSLQGDSYRNIDRPSHKQQIFVMDNKENTFYKQMQKTSVRPSSSNTEKQVPQATMPRPYSSSQREKKDQHAGTAPPGFLSQMHMPSAPVFKKPAPAVDPRGSLKKEMKNSILLNQVQKPSNTYQFTPNQFSQQKTNRFFQPGEQMPTFLQKADDRALFSSVPNEQRNKSHNPVKPGPSSSFIESKPGESVQRKNETEGTDAPKRTQEYQEYRKLQDKLQYLENKIISIKSNIDNSNSQLAKNSGRLKKEQSKKGLTAKFFNQKKAPVPESPAAPTQKAKHKQEQSTPSLSSFITQVKQSSTTPQQPVPPPDAMKRKESSTPTQSNALSTTIKNLLAKPTPPTVSESTKAASNAQKKPFSNRKSSQEMMKYSSMSNLMAKPEIPEPQFQYYVSSVIRAFMSNDTSKPFEQTREHLAQTIQAIQFAKSMKQTPQYLIEERKSILPKREQYRNKKTLIFDLDETLIHCNESVQVPGDVYLPIRFPTGEMIEASVNVRPYAQQLLELLSKHFEIIVFTASHSCYANVVLDYLDPGRQWVSHRLFRESCVQTEEGAYIKDLRVLGNRSLADVLLIDNAAYSFGLQLPNGVPILPYYDNKQDQELIHLQHYLMQFRNVRDMRDLNVRALRIDNFSDFNDPIDLLQSLFKEYIPSI